MRELARGELAPAENESFKDFFAGRVQARSQSSDTGFASCRQQNGAIFGSAFWLGLVNSLRGFLGGRSPVGSGRSADPVLPDPLPEGSRKGGAEMELRTQKGRNHVPGDGHLVERIRESPLLVAHEIGDGSPGRLLRSENLLKGRGPERGIQRNDPAAARSGLLQASWQYITWRAKQAHDPAKTAAEHWRSRASRASPDRFWSGTSRTGSAGAEGPRTRSPVTTTSHGGRGRHSNINPCKRLRQEAGVACRKAEAEQRASEGGPFWMARNTSECLTSTAEAVLSPSRRKPQAGRTQKGSSPNRCTCTAPAGLGRGPPGSLHCMSRQ